MKNLLKNILLIGAFLFALVLLIIGLNELRNTITGAEPSTEPAAVQTTGITANSATVNFTTEKPTASIVKYGSDRNNLSLFSAEYETTTTHAVVLSFLSPNTTYYYTIKIGQNEYKNAGSPWEFTTKAAGGGGASTGDYSNLDPEVFKQKFGTEDPDYDLNRDGVVNSTDYLIYLEKTQ